MTPTEILDSLAPLLLPPQVKITVKRYHVDYMNRRRVFGIVEQGTRRFAFEAWLALLPANTPPAVRVRLYRKQGDTVIPMSLKFAKDLLHIVEATLLPEFSSTYPNNVYVIPWQRSN